MQCERETEQEKEQEEEREVEPPRQTPIKETDWQYAAAVQASSVHKLPLKVQAFLTPSYMPSYSIWMTILVNKSIYFWMILPNKKPFLTLESWPFYVQNVIFTSCCVCRYELSSVHLDQAGASSICSGQPLGRSFSGCC